MRSLFVLIALLAMASPGLAAERARGGKRVVAAKASRTPSKAVPPEKATESQDGDKPASGKTPKAKVYTFTGLDVEGKLKTPQLLYFLNRVRLELDTTSPEKRSFMKELETTSDDKGL